MKLTKQRIEKVALNKNVGGRTQLEGVYYDHETGHLLTTNGFAAARIPVEAPPGGGKNELDESALIPIAKWKEWHKLKPGYVTVKDEHPELSRQFPRDFLQAQFPESAGHPILVVDARRLYELAQAICENGSRRDSRLPVKLHLPRVNKPILVLPVHGDGEGLLMEVQSPPSYILRDALNDLTAVLESGGEISKALRGKLHAALCDKA